MKYNTKEIKYVHAYIADDEKAVDIDNHRINFVISSEIVDRTSEVVEAQAVFDAIHRKNEFIDNPICLACHMHRLENGMPPAIGSWDTSTAQLKASRVEMVLQYDAEYDLGKQYWTVYKNRTMRAVSIGFRILDYRVEDRSGTRVFITTKLELIEISCVAVGCNKQALSKLKSIGILDDTDQPRSLVESIEKVIDAKLAGLREEMLAQLDDIKSLLIPDSDEDLSIPPQAKGDPLDIDVPQDGQVSEERLLSAFKNALTEI